MCAIGQIFGFDNRWPIATVCVDNAFASVLTNTSGVPVWCNWQFVHCDPRSKSVVSFDLGFSPWILRSTVPSEFGDLTNLRRIKLDYNDLTGTIPTTLGKLSQLNYLNLRSNSLNGTIPVLKMVLAPKWSDTLLDLSYNKLIGEVPAFVTNLEYTYLRQRRIRLNLYENCFLYSSVPSIRGHLGSGGNCPPTTKAAIAAEGRALCEVARAFTAAGVKIQRWDSNAGRNVYTNVFRSSDLSNWRLGYSPRNSTCSYNTSLPLYRPDWCNSWNGVECGSNYAITTIAIYGDRQSKTSHIPPTIGALTNLQNLRLNNMGLTGSIPNFAGLTRLTSLYLDNNMLTGMVPAFVDKAYVNYNYMNFNNNCNLTSTNSAIASRIYWQGKCKNNPGEAVLGVLVACFRGNSYYLSLSFAHSPCQRPLLPRVAPCVRSPAPSQQLASRSSAGIATLGEACIPTCSARRI